MSIMGKVINRQPNDQEKKDARQVWYSRFRHMIDVVNLYMQACITFEHSE